MRERENGPVLAAVRGGGGRSDRAVLLRKTEREGLESILLTIGHRYNGELAELELRPRAARSLARHLALLAEEIESRRGAPVDDDEGELLAEVPSGRSTVSLRRTVTHETTRGVEERPILLLEIAEAGRLLADVRLSSGPALILRHRLGAACDALFTAEPPPKSSSRIEPPSDPEVLVPPRAEPREPASAAPTPIRSRYAEPPPQRARRTAP